MAASLREPAESKSIVDDEQAESNASQPSSEPQQPDLLLEATEFTTIRTNYSRAATVRSAPSSVVSQGGLTGLTRLIHLLWSFWRNQISIMVDHVSHRDHLALERTFLGYLRTSLALSMIGVIVAQLFRLQHSPNPSTTFGFYVLGKPLAVICQSVAIWTLLLGAFRTWRVQNALVRGKAIRGGCELVLIGLGVLCICIMFFVLVVAVNVSKDL